MSDELYRYGFTRQQWQAAKEEIHQILTERAKKGDKIHYLELARKLRSVELEAYSAALYALLDELSREEDKAGRGMLSVVVVNKADDLPGQGFFDLAQELGRPNVKDKFGCWAAEFTKVHAYWSGAR